MLIRFGHTALDVVVMLAAPWTHSAGIADQSNWLSMLANHNPNNIEGAATPDPRSQSRHCQADFDTGVSAI
jgi:hypothetical protein